MITLILFVIGVLVGVLSAAIVLTGRHKRKRVGKLRMDDSTGDFFLFMELAVPVDYILGQNEILLEVDLTPITRE